MTASDKLYFRIGEVADLLKIKTSVLRFWETQFEQLRPQKTKTGQRLYSRSDMELAKQIQHLLYQEKLTIAGAKARIGPSRKDDSAGKNDSAELLRSIKLELQNLRNILD